MFLLFLTGCFVFMIGVLGVFIWYRHLLAILFSFELMALAIVINFIGGSVFLDDISGQLFSIFILTVVASESAIGLALTIAFYRLHGSISIELIDLLKS